MLKIIWNNTIMPSTNANTPDTLYLSGSVVAVTDAHIADILPVGTSVTVFSDAVPELVDWAGKGQHIEASPAGSYDLGGKGLIGYNLRDVLVKNELSAEETASFKGILAAARFNRLAATARPSALRDRKAPPTLTAAVAAAEKPAAVAQAPVAAGADL
jgi:hypothetical protein